MNVSTLLSTQPQPFSRTTFERLARLELGAVGVALLAVLMVAQAVHGFTDPDYWWHYKTGEYIVMTHSIPHHDFFTSTADGRPWVAHEWLSEALIYGLVR